MKSLTGQILEKGSEIPGAVAKVKRGSVISVTPRHPITVKSRGKEPMKVKVLNEPIFQDGAWEVNYSMPGFKPSTPADTPWAEWDGSRWVEGMV